MRVKIHLETTSDAINLANLVKDLKSTPTITDGAGHCVNAKSVLGALYALEFKELWFECEEDLYRLIDKYIVI